MSVKVPGCNVAALYSPRSVTGLESDVTGRCLEALSQRYAKLKRDERALLEQSQT